MAVLFRNGKIVVSKVNLEGPTIETLCVEVERATNKKQDKSCEIVLYPLLDANNNYIFESITTAIKAGLKKEYIEQEIKKYIVNKDNYDYQEEIKENVTGEKESNKNDSIEVEIFAAKNLDELASIYRFLEINNLITRYKNIILSRLKEINIDYPFFYVEINKHKDDWLDERSNYFFTLYMYKVNLLLQKYSHVKYDEMLNFNNIQVRKNEYLEELLYNFMEQWAEYESIYIYYDYYDEDFREEYEMLNSTYSKFETAQYHSYAIARLYLILKNHQEVINNFISENIKEMLLQYDKKLRNKMVEINMPSLSFEHSYMQALKTNDCIYYAKAFFQAKSNEEIKKIKLLETTIRNSFFNIDECLLLEASIFECRTIRDLEISIIALIALLDNINLKNSPNFKRLHLLFYQSIINYVDRYMYMEDSSQQVILKIKELYENNYYKYDENIKREYKLMMK